MRVRKERCEQGNGEIAKTGKGISREDAIRLRHTHVSTCLQEQADQRRTRIGAHVHCGLKRSVSDGPVFGEGGRAHFAACNPNQLGYHPWPKAGQKARGSRFQLARRSTPSCVNIE